MCDSDPSKKDEFNKTDLSLKYQEGIKSLEIIDSLLNKEYLHEVKNNYHRFPFSDYNTKDGTKSKISYDTNIRALHVKRWVYDKEEQTIDKFKNILNVFAGEKTNLAFLVKRDKKRASLYFILKNETHNNEISDNNKELLKNAITGNFNGTIINGINIKKVFISDSDKKGDEQSSDSDKKEDEELILQRMEKIDSISCLTNIPSEKSERFISQGLEKLLDGIIPEKDDEYYILILAEPLTFTQIKDIQNGYEELASAIVPYSGYQLSISETEGESKGEMESLTNSKNTFSSVTKTHSVSVGASVGIGKVGVSANVSEADSETEGEGESKGKTEGKDYHFSVSKTKGATYNYQSYAIKALLEKLQKQLERINNGTSLGLWKCASYVLATDPIMAKNVASFLKSLIQGDESYIEPPIINTWSKNEPSFSDIKQYLLHFTHPIFKKKDNSEYIITPTYNVTTNELSAIMAFPRKSVAGLPVLECAAFGREVITFSNEEDQQPKGSSKEHTPSNYEGDILLGSPYHMHKTEKDQQPIKLNKESLKKHTFITGSTGSGKSNTVYQILSEINKADVKFLVIEPAKGEYKNVFGKKKDDIDRKVLASVYGTNPELTPLLQINPFSFPNEKKYGSKKIHVLEHLDRLIEIFNVCWPMYAAMPAILKDAIEKSYEQVGWDLPSSTYISTNKSGPVKYPTFANVTENIRKILDSSDYSNENKGDYKGALITRLESLTNSINGMIFTDDEPEDTNEKLFDKNVIVDLSRVGSTETKSLIMGILIMKLQEYRQANKEKMDDNLRHITVLEEAHNLLKRTSTEQSSETANLLGKSVEMLANAIAEMRTYGEGFIIADQSPGLLDMSVIRNTNTKIIMHLPDEGDRILVGKAAGLNDDQIVELAKLQIGVAAVYQNDWIQPVLCMVEEFKYDKDFIYQETDTEINKKTSAVVNLKRYAKNEKIDKDKLKEKIEAIDIADFKKLEQGFIASLFRNNEKVFIEAKKAAEIETRKKQMPHLKNYLVQYLEPTLSDYDEKYREYILTCIVLENCSKNKFEILPEVWNDFILKEGVL